MKNKWETVKLVSGVVISVGVSAIMGEFLRSNSPTQINAFKKLCVGIGGFALASMVANKTVDYADEKIEELESKFKVEEPESV